MFAILVESKRHYSHLKYLNNWELFLGLKPKLCEFDIYYSIAE